MEKLQFKKLSYVKRMPKNFDETKKYPLVIYVHGAGGRGTDINKIYEHTFFNLTQDHLADAVSVAPQCYADSWFDIFEQLEELVGAMTELEYVDRARVYLMGASMGGYTTWQLGMSHPELFAAILPICGGGMYWNAARLKNTAVWAFHGDIDQTVLCDESRKMVEKLEKVGGNVKFTVYENTGHNAWSPTFSDPAVWKWVFEQRNSYVTEIRTEFNDTKTFG